MYNHNYDYDPRYDEPEEPEDDFDEPDDPDYDNPADDYIMTEPELRGQL